MTEPLSPVPSSTGADLFASVIRTIVPLIVGPLIARFGFDPDDPGTTLWISAVASGIYYLVVRLLELKAPTLGYLLGVAKQPTYVNPPAIVTDEEGTHTVGDIDSP